MTFTTETLAKLAAPLDPKRVKKREGGGGRSLSYLEGHDVIRTANDTFGPGEWGYHIEDLTCLGAEPFERKDFKTGEVKKGIRVGYRAIVAANVGPTVFSDVGYGDAQEYNGSEITPHELAAKEAVTDALKRALKNFGDPFGLVLYDKYAPEHDGRNGNGSSSPAPAPGRQGAAAPLTETHAAAPAFPTDEFRFASGKYQGKTFAEVPRDYAVWCAENHPKPEVQEVAKVWLGLTSPALADDDIPF